MKKAILTLMLSFLTIIASNVYAEDFNESEYDDEEGITDMFKEYINDNSSIDDKKSIEMNENEYVFEYYPYLTVKYTSRTLKDEDIINK